MRAVRRHSTVLRARLGSGLEQHTLGEALGALRRKLYKLQTKIRYQLW